MECERCFNTGAFSFEKYFPIHGFVEATLCTTSTVQSYVVDYQHVLCTMVLEGDLLFWEVRVTPTFFILGWFIWNILRRDTFCQ